MPFGAQFEAGNARFGLWAPGARSVELCIEDVGGPAVAAMTPVGGGWFESTARGVPAGTRYRYRIDGGQRVPDPASRCNPDGVHGPSEVVDAAAYDWQDAGWAGRPWHEAVIYELHVGTFAPGGTFLGVMRRLEDLKELGVTAIELMPIAEFAGARNWGYDGVLPFAPHRHYGRPDELKRLVDEAHRLGLMMLLDVVYNHFGPEGNYLHVYAPQFFTGRHQTPWGAAINLDGEGSRIARDFFIHNALYWLEEFHFDGLRLDAVHAIADDSEFHILTEIAQAVRRGPGRARHVHLVLENDDNAARYLVRDADGPRWYDAQWNDDFHHAVHVLLTGERDGYYADYAGMPVRLLARALAEGYAYQGEHSVFRGRPRGEPSVGLPPCAFVNFLQNHDQIGNRAFGERLAMLAPADAVRAGLALLLLAPAVPLMFMGEEFGCTQPFVFFCDFEGELARAVKEGRRGEFSRLERFHDAAARSAIPDPNAATTFAAACIDWAGASRPENAAWQAFIKRLLEIRRVSIVPRARQLGPGAGRFETEGETALFVEWDCPDGSGLAVAANLGREAVRIRRAVPGELIYAYPVRAVEALKRRRLEPWSVIWTERGGARP
jgi:malto-oligosyltrehalose trehalohydrolase